MLVLLTALVIGLSGCASAEQSEADLEDNRPVAEWIDLTYSLVALERQTPPVASRTYAYIMVALYEGWAHGIEGRESLAGALNGLEELPVPETGRRYDWSAVATTAAYAVAHHALGEHTRMATVQALDNLRQEQLDRRKKQGISEAVLERSRVYGESLAEALITWMDEDGYPDTRQLAYTPPSSPEHWSATADYGITVQLDGATQVTHLFDGEEGEGLSQAEMIMRRWQSDKMLHMNHPGTISDWSIAQEPHWGQIRPLVVDLDEHEVVPHKPYSEDEASLFYEELMQVYNVSQRLTDEHLKTVHFWMDGPGETGTPGGHWMKLAGQLAQEHELALPETLELALLVGAAVFDSHVACWRAKFEYNLVRPKTLIRRRVDEHWDAPIPIPNHPEYPSGHASTSGAAAVPLTATFGEVSFVDKTHEHRYGFTERSYDTFQEAAQEAADSRLYAGLHFPMGNQNGLNQGEQVGRTVTERLLTHMRGTSVELSLPEQLFEAVHPDEPLQKDRWLTSE